MQSTKLDMINTIPRNTGHCSHEDRENENTMCYEMLWNAMCFGAKFDEQLQSKENWDVFNH